jgi:ubiquinone/menaquinone biosynthesis C-methylase UbiE
MAGYVGGTGTVYALDIQQPMLDILMKRARLRGVESRIRPVLSDSRDLPVPVGLDFALAFWMLHEVDGQAGLLKGISSVLKPGGSFLLVEPRVHVTKKAFEKELELCRTAGFTPAGTPEVALSRAVLFSR